MNLIDALKEKGLPFRVPDCSRDNLPQFLKDMNYKVGVEVGVFRGEFTAKLCRVGLKMYAIDPWRSFAGQGRSQLSQEIQDYNFRRAEKRLSRYPNCTIIRKSSMEALNDFGPESLDFVYIDGDHRFKYVAEDVCEWYQKVKQGGLVLGDDYDLTRPSAQNLICQVRPVINAYVEAYGIENFYVFDNSWMFFKP